MPEPSNRWVTGGPEVLLAMSHEGRVRTTTVSTELMITALETMFDALAEMERDPQYDGPLEDLWDARGQVWMALHIIDGRGPVTVEPGEDH